MTDMTTEQERGFRAGIEAAAEHLESEAAEYRRRGRNLWSLDREVAAKEIRALAPAAPEPSLRPMGDAPRDGMPILVRVKPDLYPAIRPTREDLKPWNGCWMVVRWSGSDICGWSVSAPVGYGGFTDEWFVGWCPTPDAAAPEPTDAPHGYVFHNPDTGWEYAVSHPVLSGEVPDADNIRPATEFEADLCKQISRLKAAAPEPTEAEVERVAERMAGRLYTAWDSLPDYTKGRYRELARAALAAAGGE